jgi:hypothetical protein
LEWIKEKYNDFSKRTFLNVRHSSIPLYDEGWDIAERFHGDIIIMLRTQVNVKVNYNADPPNQSNI